MNELGDGDGDGLIDEVQRHRMPLLEHLRELRNRVIVMGIGVIVGLIIGMVFAKDVIDVLTAPVKQVLPGSGEPNQMDLLYLQLTKPLMTLPGWEWLITSQARGDLVLQSSLEGVWTWLRAAFLFGGLLALPLLAYQVWAFVAPGLYKTERKYVLPLSIASTFLFLVGAGFAYFVIVPMAFGFFLNFLDLENVLSIEDATNTVVRIVVAFGACYQLPVVVWFLSKIGIIDHWDMIKGFRYAIVGIFIIAALVTPPDVITQFFLGVPLVGLYGVSIVVAWFATSKKRLTEEEKAELML